MSTYIDDVPGGRNGGTLHRWHEHTALRLLWQYGPERTTRILSGLDEKTNADIAKWRALGSR